MSGRPATTGVLFVCLGNICRSPLAEGVFRHRAAGRGVLDRFDVDSAGTGDWHAGERADARMRAVAESRGVSLESRARAVVDGDFERFHHILAMDRSNLETLRRRGAPADRTRLFLSAVPDAVPQEVPDPWSGGARDFEHVWTIVSAAVDAWLDQLAPGSRTD